MNYIKEVSCQAQTPKDFTLSNVFLFTSWERDYKNKSFKLNVIKYFQNSSHYSKSISLYICICLCLATSEFTVMVLMVCLCTFNKCYLCTIICFVVLWLFGMLQLWITEVTERICLCCSHWYHSSLVELTMALNWSPQPQAQVPLSEFCEQSISMAY